MCNITYYSINRPVAEVMDLLESLRETAVKEGEEEEVAYQCNIIIIMMIIIRIIMIIITLMIILAVINHKSQNRQEAQTTITNK